MIYISLENSYPDKTDFKLGGGMESLVLVSMKDQIQGKAKVGLQL